MNKPILSLIYILRDNIYLHGETVPLIKRSYPLDKTPCITLDDSGGGSVESKQIINIQRFLGPDHPQLEQYRGERVPRQAIRERRNMTVKINVWFDKESEREKLTNQIMHLLYLAQSDHYRFCKNHVDGFCDFLEAACPASESDDSIRTVKNQCPKPLDYHYINIFTQFDLIRATFNVDQPYPLDDLSTNTPTLRSVIPVTTSFYDYHIIGGAITQDLVYDDSNTLIE